jgi:putative Ca2+/H+ antiporter (TMEM165/GDT1 family)
MTNAVIIWVWGLVFFFAAIPGAVSGWIIGALFGSSTGVILSLVVSVIAGAIATEKSYPGSLNAMSAGVFYAFYYPMFFIPPFLAAMLLGVWISNLTSRAR